MNILFFLTPKSEVAHIYEDDTVRQALDKMEGFRYSTIPLLSKDGTYVGTITEGDLLWGIRKGQSLCCNLCNVSLELCVLCNEVLCREDCKGICNRCGANLNHTECSCDRSSPDPRMSVIQDLFQKFKEV